MFLYIELDLTCPVVMPLVTFTFPDLEPCLTEFMDACRYAPTQRPICFLSAEWPVEEVA